MQSWLKDALLIVLVIIGVPLAALIYVLICGIVGTWLTEGVWRLP